MATGSVITVTDTATALRTGDTGVSGAKLTIKNTGAGSVFLGASDVTDTSGYELEVNDVLTIELAASEELYGISAAAGSNDVHVLLTGE